MSGNWRADRVQEGFSLYCFKWEIHSSLGIDWSDPLIRREFSLGKEQKWSSLMVQQ